MTGERVFSRISIRNFKSVREAQLDLRPLTVLVGENSAGKSSILQSIFLLAQIAQSRGQPDTVSLNSMELNLGNFPDVLHASAAQRIIEIGLTMPTDGLAIRRRHQRGAVIPQVPPEAAATGQGGAGPTWTLRLADSPDELGVAKVASIRIEDPVAGIALDVRPNEDRGQADEMWARSVRLRPMHRPGLRRRRPVEDEIPETAFSGQANMLRAGAGDPEDFFPAVDVESGLPVELYGVESEPFVLAQQWVRITLRRAGHALPIRSRAWSEPLSDDDQADATDVAERLFPSFRKWVDEFDRGVESESRSETAVDESTMKRALLLGDAVPRELGRLLEPVREDLGALVPRPSSSLEVASYFSAVMSGVHYLGPLRAEPSPSYRPGQGGEIGIAKLGMKGEYTVAVLHTNKLLRVQCPMGDGELKLMPLGDAVKYWARKFGFASGINTRNLGRPGIELEVLDPQTDQARDLTSVGVGVSQLLPVIVLCLRARPGELILLEQPELHLHPAPQQILGDFLLALAASGRQLLIETHSEYLINRLRLSVAEDEFGATQDLVRIWYATRTGGQTQFKAMDPDRFGSFPEWPEGFFDQAPAESEAILRAIAKKRHASR